MSVRTVVTELNANDLAQIASWWRLGVPFVDEPNAKWLKYVLEKENVHAFCLRPMHDRQTVLSYAQFDVEENDAWVAVVTHPHETRNGYALQLMRECVDQMATLGVQRIIAAVERENEPSIRFFLQAGFATLPATAAKEMEEGFVYLVLSGASVGKTT